MNKRILAVVITIFMVLTFLNSCTKSVKATVEPMYYFAPTSISDPLKNPNMGWTTYEFRPFLGRGSTALDGSLKDTQLKPGDVTNFYDLSDYAYSNFFTWRDLEPKEGEYDWDKVDQFVNYYEKKNMKVGIGFHLADPTSIQGVYHIPDYVLEILKKTTKNKNGQTLIVAGKTYQMPPIDGFYYNSSEIRSSDNPEWLKFEPNYWNEEFLNKLGKFIDAFAEHYGKTEKWAKNIISMDISTYGKWGEWHSTIDWPGATLEEKENGKYVVLKRMVDQYFDAFNTKAGAYNGKMRLSMNVVGNIVGTTLEKQAVKYAIDKGADMTRRCIGEPSFMMLDEATIIAENADKKMLHGEWGAMGNAIVKFKFSGMSTQEAIEMALSMKASTLGWYIGIPGNYPLRQIHTVTGERLEDYYQRIGGYRLVLANAEIKNKLEKGKEFSLEQNWLQIGNATMYEKYNLKAYLVNGTKEYELGLDKGFNAKGWLKDNTFKKVKSKFTIPSNIEDGTYDLRIALVDDSGKPAINIAIEGKDIDNAQLFGRYTIGKVKLQGGSFVQEQIKTKNISNNLNLSSKKVTGYEGYAGVKITVGEKPLFISAIGKFNKSISNNTELLVVRKKSKETIFTINTEGAPITKKNGFDYINLNDYLILKPNETYYILAKTSSKDVFYDNTSTVSAAEGVTIDSGVITKDLYDFSTNDAKNTLFPTVDIIYNNAFVRE